MTLKNALPVLFTLLLFGCNNSNKNPVKAEDIAVKESHEHAVDNHKEPTGALALNNGIKWQSDESTRKHSANLVAETNAFNAKANADTNAYHAFAADMQKELNSLISDCRMKGPDHDALHLWLEPVMTDVNDLKKTGTVDEAKKVTEKLTDKVQMFDKYFK